MQKNCSEYKSKSKCEEIIKASPILPMNYCQRNLNIEYEDKLCPHECVWKYSNSQNNNPPHDIKPFF